MFHQKQALVFHLESKYSINGFEMGLGKTALAISLCETVGGECLVVCPAYLKHNWAAELEKFSIGKANYTLVSYSMLSKFAEEFKTLKFSCIIFDEAHYLKNMTASRTIIAHELVRAIKPEYMLGLTGTPVKNRVPEWYSLILLCSYGHQATKHKLEKHRVSFYKFCNMFSYPKPGAYGGWFGIKNIPTLKKLLEPIYYRKTAEGLPDRMEKLVESGSCDFEEELLQAFNSLHFSTIKAKNAAIKTQQTIEYVKEMLEEGLRVVVFTDHVESANLLASYFKVNAITGAVSAENRHRIIANFEAKKDKVIIGTIGAMSVGVNLVSTNHMVFNDIPWVPADLAQAEGRIRRITQKHTCFYHYMLSGKMDKMIYKTIKDKQKVLEKCV